MASVQLKVGQPAPPFALPDQAGNLHRVEHYAGQWLVVYFYPRDDTPGCTREACGFRDVLADVTGLGAQVLGVSPDGNASHRRFAQKYRLTFPLLSDVHGETAQAYGSYFQFTFLRLVKRRTYIIDPHGRIAKIYAKVGVPAAHAAQVLQDLRLLQNGTGS